RPRLARRDAAPRARGVATRRRAVAFLAARAEGDEGAAGRVEDAVPAGVVVAAHAVGGPVAHHDVADVMAAQVVVVAELHLAGQRAGVEAHVGILAEPDRPLLGDDAQLAAAGAVVAEVVETDLAGTRNEHVGRALTADAGGGIGDQVASDGGGVG